ncbi:ATP-binding protein [Chitinophaga sp.]|uniref:AAA family ATPase n=1 Tax=Chitinophaga sp. TaxID=1869181 RepID=UPI0031CF5FD3
MDIVEQVVGKYLVDLVTAALEGNSQRAEVIALSLSRSLRKENLIVAKKIDDALSLFSLRGSSAMRGGDVPPPPIDADTHAEMAKVISPANLTLSLPILNLETEVRIKAFLNERVNVGKLIENGIKPSNSLLFVGLPGTGKTMLAHYIARELNKNLVVLDLSASISSLLGKTGHNLKKVLEYAKKTSAVLLLDEFDAIAKRRDDSTDLGEIKRVVNVLLMELEEWPVSSVLIATSNHPELLDRAIWRRFDHSIEVGVPEEKQRILLLERDLGSFVNIEKEGGGIIVVIAKLLEGKSAADVIKFCNNVKRKIILNEQDPIEACFNELDIDKSEKKTRGTICILLKQHFGAKITVRRIAEITKLSSTAVQHHLKKISHE